MFRAHKSRGIKSRFTSSFSQESASDLLKKAVNLSTTLAPMEDIIHAFEKAAHAGSGKAALILGKLYDPCENNGMQDLHFVGKEIIKVCLSANKNFEKSTYYYSLSLQQGEMCYFILDRYLSIFSDASYLERLQNQNPTCSHYLQLSEICYQFLKHTINVILYEKNDFEKTKTYNEKLFKLFESCNQLLIKKLQQNFNIFDDDTLEAIHTILGKMMQVLSEYISVELYHANIFDLFEDPSVDQEKLKQYQFVAALEGRFRECLNQYRNYFEACFKQAQSLMFTTEEDKNHPAKAFRLLENIIQQSPRYAEAQYLMAIIICHYSKHTSEDFALESNEDKMDRISAMLPYLERAASFGYALAIRAYKKYSQELTELVAEANLQEEVQDKNEMVSQASSTCNDSNKEKEKENDRSFRLGFSG